jgi:RHS repeat-associated protein
MGYATEFGGLLMSSRIIPEIANLHRNLLRRRVPSERKRPARAMFVLLSLGAALLSGLFASDRASAADAPPLMTVPGQFNVSASGAATYSIPIAVPPGTAGMMPTLSLDYSSQAGDGVVGWQWALDGLPAITRCARSIQEDGVHGGVNYDGNDRFCIGGQRLMAISGADGANNTVYHTEIDMFIKVVSFGTAGTGPSYFKLWTKSGQVLELGNTTDSKILAVGSSTVRAWTVNKATDTKGNYLTVSYTNDTTNGQFYPTRIDYTGNAGASVSPYNSVQFTYNTTRVDVTPTYQAGSLLQTTALLTNIKTYEGANLVSDYRLAYTAGTTTTHTRLTSVTLCDPSSVCLAPTSFTWQGGTGLPSMTTTANSLAQGTNLLSGEFNGDGLTDALVKNPSNLTCPTGGIVSSGSAAGTFAAANMTMGYTYWPAPSHTATPYTSIACYFKVTGGLPFDFNGDGYTDILLQEFYWNAATTSLDPITVPLGNDHSGGLPKAHQDVTMPPLNILGDFDGDGRTDGYVQSPTSGNGNAYISDGTGVFTPDGGQTGLGVGSLLYPGDYDGDGCTDMLSQGTTNAIVYFCHPATSSVSITHWTGAQLGIYPGDYNGDGKTDVLMVDSTGATLYLSTGTGLSSNSIASSSTWSGYTVATGDWNGDGRCDIALISHTSGTPHLIFLSTGTGFTQVSTIANSDTNALAVVADWNNDGAPDIWLQKASGDTEYLFAYVPEAIASIDNGIGATITVTYDRLNKNGSFYAKGTATYPDIALDGAFYAVSQVDSSNGIGGNFTQTYAYTGAMGNANAFLYSTQPSNTMFGVSGISSARQAGALRGFTTIAATDAQTGIVTTTTYRTDFPYTGVVASQTRVLSGTTLGSVVNTWASSTFSGTSTSYYTILLSQSVVSGDEIGGASHFPTTTTTYTYDSYANATDVNASVSYAGSVSSTTDVTSTFTNDTTNWILGQRTRATTVRTLSGATTLTRVACWTHDGAGAVTREVIEPLGGSCAYATAGVQTDYTLDTFGNRTVAAVSGTGVTTRSSSATYDAVGRFVATTTDAGGFVQTYTSDNRFGTLLSHVDQNSQTTSWTYDTFGRPTLQTNPDGTKNVTQYTRTSTCTALFHLTDCPPVAAIYSSKFSLSSTGVQISPDIVTAYDALMRPYVQLVQVDTDFSITGFTVYDTAGRVGKVSRPYWWTGGSPNYTTYAYDAKGRVTTQTAPGSVVTTYAYSGLTSSVTNALSQVTSSTNNPQGLTASVTDALSHTTTYTYDAFGAVKTVTDPAGNVITNTYDVRGNRTAASDPDLGSWSYTYDVLGELATQTDAKSQVTTLTYDLLGRPTQASESGVVSNWVYDGATHGARLPQISCTSASSNPTCASATTTKTFTYDTLSRPSTTTINVDSTNHVYTTAYNTLNGGIDTVTYPSGLVTKNLYSAHGYLCRVTDGGGSHTCTTTSDGHVLWTMNTLDPELHLLSQTAGNAAFTTTQTFYANTGLLDTVRAGPSSALAQFDYAYDALGNLTYRSDDLNSVFERYCYDSLNRLTTSATKATDPATCSATGAGITAKTIAYDQVGNITSKNDVGTYSYPSSGSARPHAISSITGTVNGVTNPSYTYDANGNMTVSAGRTVTYTAFNMAASIIQGTTADCLSYDSGHARIKMEVRASTCGGTLSATTYYLNDPISGTMSEKLVAGGTTTWHDYVAAGGGLVAERSCTGATPCSSGATWSFFVSDHLGSIAVITNAAGTATEQLSYDAWGRRRNLNGTDNSACSITSATSRGYTGHEMLDSICEINANARIYDPTVARFMTPDSMIPDPFDGQSFNRYSYVLNNPLALVDPSGHAETEQAPKPMPKYWVNHDPYVVPHGGPPCWGCFGPGVFGVGRDGNVISAAEMTYVSHDFGPFTVTARANVFPIAALYAIAVYGLNTAQIALKSQPNDGLTPVQDYMPFPDADPPGTYWDKKEDYENFDSLTGLSTNPIVNAMVAYWRQSNVQAAYSAILSTGARVDPPEPSLSVPGHSSVSFFNGSIIFFDRNGDNFMDMEIERIVNGQVLMNFGQYSGRDYGAGWQPYNPNRIFPPPDRPGEGPF